MKTLLSSLSPRFLKVLLLFCTSVTLAGVGVYQFLQPPTLSYVEDFAPYISGFTTGSVPRKSAISILLNFDRNDTTGVGQYIENNLLDFEPSIDGKLRWLDQRNLEFQPDKPLDSDQEYYCTFRLGELLDTLPKKLRKFVFKFRTFKQDFRIDYEGLSPLSNSDPIWQQLTGRIQANDVLDSAGTMKMVSATQNGRALSIHWDLTEIDWGSHMARFTIDSIRRGESEDKVHIEINGESIGVDRCDKRDFTVPSMGSFNVQEAVVEQYPEQSLLIRFSDPIRHGQQLQGMIRIEGQPEPRLIMEENCIRLFPSAKLKGSYQLLVNAGIENVWGYKMNKGEKLAVEFLPIKPAVRLVSQGVILPDAGKLFFPFEAVGMKAVNVTVYKLFENNILQFLQVNDLEGQTQIHRVGKKVAEKRIELKYDIPADLEFWQRYAIDLGSLIRTEPGAMYRVKLEMNKADALWECPAGGGEEEHEEENYDEYGENISKPDFTQYYQEDGLNDDYTWDYGYESDYYSDPCNSYYYSERRIGHNVLASDLGVIAKREPNGKLHIMVSNLLTTQPVANATVLFYNYQQQVIAQGTTDAQGMIERSPNMKPYVVVVKSGTQRGYLKLDEGASLSMSNFDVDGRTSEKGIKGFIYGERGVWRPGDSLYLNFVLEDPLKSVPAKHPVTMELINPMGQLVSKLTRTESVHGFYDFRTATSPDAPTGNWMVQVHVGNRSFTKNIKIETVKPNRLKIYLDFAEKMLSRASKKDTAFLQVKWLHGALAKNLSVDVDASISQATTSFPAFKGYTFDDALRGFESRKIKVYDDFLDENGKAKFSLKLDAGKSAPGFLRAYFNVRAFEQGGDFSTDRFSVMYSPYASYAGIKTPDNGEGGRSDMMETGKLQSISMVSVKEDGTPGTSRLQVKVYKLNWQWWWDRYDDDINYYLSRPGIYPVFDSTYSTVNGKAQLNLKMEEKDWGRYMIRVTDLQSGHSCGKVVYFESPWWQRGNSAGSQFASMLSFSVDKESYKTGDKVKLSIPSAGVGKALISVESGERVLQKFWIDTQKGETHAEFTCTAEMAPNAYVFVTLLQPHGSVQNDLPLRLYGILPISVEDPATHIQPLIKMADVLEPESTAKITVKEEKGRAMTYTLALVDEGLLDLTHFETPQPWDEFYQKEALRVKTWDLYDWVIGAYGGKLNRILSIGGDGSGLNGKAAKANRFKPVVRFVGPFYLAAGEAKTHSIQLPQYIGSVRVMVVAGNEGAYGNAEKSVPVKKPLMVLATLPRVLGPDESIALPVNIFAMEDYIKDVTVQVEVNSLLSMDGPSTQKITFSRPGDEVLNFRLKVAQRIGVAHIKVTARSGNQVAVQDFEVDVRPSNSPYTQINRIQLEAGKEQSLDVPFTGLDGSHQLVLETSVLPVDISKRMDYLISYPHGCIEQTTSAAFPQLAMQPVMDLSNAQQVKITQNIKAALNRIALFQTTAGGFAYWPGDSDDNEWGSNYAGHFMLEAERMGYTLPVGMKTRWLKYQKTQAQNWSDSRISEGEQLTQAYRLYTLALAANPELGAMNRMRESKALTLTARWRLAAAYAQSGQSEVAKQLIHKQLTRVKRYVELANTFGTAQRDEAMILETLVLLKDNAQADRQVENLIQELNSDKWMSTQTTAYSLIAIGKYMNAQTSGNALNYSYQLDQQAAINRVQSKSAAQEIIVENANRGKHKITLRNNSRSKLHVRLVRKYIPLQGDEPTVNKTVQLISLFRDMAGKIISPDKLKQGSDFVAEVTIVNPSKRYLQKMTLNQLFPSGWEIRNIRMEESSSISSDPSEYQDIRDDRVYTYYAIPTSNRRTYRVLLNASYRGRFYLPGIETEAMYDREIYARSKGRWVEVF